MPKLDGQYTQIVAKIIDTLRALLNNDEAALAQHVLVNEQSLDDYMLGWSWNTGKYRADRGLRETVDALGKELNSIDNVMKQKLANYNAAKGQLQQLQRKKQGNLSVRSLADVVHKEDFVDGLAAKAREVGLRVWYDRFALVWGDSIRRKIDEGLAGSYFGIAVLSPSFFAKEWTNYELDGLVEKASSGAGRLLPIWHKLTKDEVIKHSPSLANRLALNTAFKSTDEIVAELVTLRNLYRSNGGPG